jgi:hypothetical protein
VVRSALDVWLPWFVLQVTVRINALPTRKAGNRVGTFARKTSGLSAGGLPISRWFTPVIARSKLTLSEQVSRFVGILSKTAQL